MDLYDFPELYDALRAPDVETLELIRNILKHEFPDGCRSMMDPACGPGNWLLPFADSGMHLAGNDLSRRMVGYARDNLGALGAEVTQGDMRQLAFRSGPFDVALEASGSACMLPEKDDFEGLLASIEAHVRPNGLAILTLFFRDRDQDAPRPRVLHELGPVPIRTGGTATIRYESLDWNPRTGHECMRRTVRTQGVPEAPAELIDEFVLRIWTVDELNRVVNRTRHLDYVAAFDLEDGTPRDPRDGDLHGEQLVVLRRHAVAARAGESSGVLAAMPAATRSSAPTA